ncbi:hypothetical protein [Aquimarina spongiae]|uniref:Uncharacterized protein n=1 Tax=Aquimarina spongiae TaxID=570521 RepID=A0A1M6J339_9FLAO|nr:hypothetical protein [Aquimarina spongiae]SHJ40951.1 hypothetical protein SAMN04488508_108210 [Aquimarina spongiae]
MKTRKFKISKNIDVKSLTTKMSNSKWVCTLLLTVLYIAPTFAQSDDINAQISTWGDQIKTILNAVVGIFSIAGGFLIFIQYMQGNEQAQKNFIRFIIGLAIFGLVALIANVFLPDVGGDAIG